MSGFGKMLSHDVEGSVLKDARELAGSDIKSLLREQSEAIQHILAVSSVLALRVEELEDGAAPGRLAPSSVAVSSHSSECPLRPEAVLGAVLSPQRQEADAGGNLQPTALPKVSSIGICQDYLEPLLAGSFSPPSPAASRSISPGRQPSIDDSPGPRLRAWLRSQTAPFSAPETPRALAEGPKSWVKTPPRRLFPDVSHVQGFLKETLHKDAYAVEDYYKTTGFCQAIARDENFRNLTFLVIFLNTLWIGYDTDHNGADVLCNADWLFQVGENFFCCYFSFEVLVRFLAFKEKRNALCDAWFMFDSLLVTFMVWETWVSVFMYLLLHSVNGAGGAATILRIFRLFRLTRVARLGRLINAVPELMLLVKGMAMAVRSVGSTLGLMFVIIYVFAILFTQLLRETNVGQGKFETVPMSIDYLLVGSVFPDQRDDLQDMLAENWVYYIVLIIYLLLGSITVMNLLIGVLCEVVSVVAEAEKREGIEYALKQQLLEIMDKVDQNADHVVDGDEMVKIMENREAVVLLDDMGIDVYALAANLETFFIDKPMLNMEEFFTQLMLFRNSNTVTQKDMIVLKRSLDTHMHSLFNVMKSMSEGRHNITL